MKVVTICGSMKFADQMQKIAWELETKKGYCVLQPVYHDKKKTESFSELEALYLNHNKKIEMADAIYVVNINGYIGETTKNGIAFAKSNKKEIIYHEELK